MANSTICREKLLVGMVRNGVPERASDEMPRLLGNWDSLREPVLDSFRKNLISDPPPLIFQKLGFLFLLIEFR